MSEQVGLNVEHMVALQNQMQQFHQAVGQEWSQTMNQWSNLQSVWRDQQYEKFAPLMEQFASTYSNVDQACEQFTAFIQQQIQIAEDRKSRMGQLQGM